MAERAKSIYDVVFGQTDFTKNGKCSNCGSCCSDLLPLTRKEVETIKRYIKEHNIVEQKNFPVVAQNFMDMTCPFRDEKNKVCTIYEVRPSICKAFLCSHRTADIQKNKHLKYNEKYEVQFMRKLFFDSDDDKAFIENFMLIKQIEKERGGGIWL